MAYSRWFVILVLIVVAVAACRKDRLRAFNVTTLVSNTTDRLNRVRCLGNDCFAAGGELFERTTILHSADGGYTWTAGSYPVAGKAMFGFAVSGAGIMYACGIDGIVLHSADTGRNWRMGRILDWKFYVGASFATPDTGVFVSSVLQREGAIVQVDTAFNIISQDTFQHGINNVYMVSPSTGYVIGYGAVLKTTDHRRTWIYQDVQGDNFTAMDVHGDEIWMCGSNGSVFHTANGGAKWERLRNGNSLTIPRYMLRDILFTDAAHGWATGDDGLLIYTEDGGHNWMEYEPFTKNALRSITRTQNGDLLICGDKGALYRVSLQP